MTEEQFEDKFENGEFDEEYAEYIMSHNDGSRIIHNGDSLVRAIESGYMYESFKDYMTREK